MIEVSVLFSEPKIPQSDMLNNPAFTPAPVSVLFSEPKIPQSAALVRSISGPRRFSALQRAENSSIPVGALLVSVLTPEFQCSSASRKFLNPALSVVRAGSRLGFSALQRAENSSIRTDGVEEQSDFCGFSALQRAENSSIAFVFTR